MNNTYKSFIRVYKTFFYFIIELNTNNYYIIYILDILDFIKTKRKYIVLDFFLTQLHPSDFPPSLNILIRAFKLPTSQ